MQWKIAAGVVAATVFVAEAAQAQPSMSRGEQTLNVGYADCMARARRAFEALGWVNIGAGGAFTNAFKGTEGAYITCNELSPGRVVVNIFVASNHPDANRPGAERVVLQNAMNQAAATPPRPPAPPPPPAASPPVAGRSFEWFDNGRRLGVIAFNANGGAVIDWYPQYRDQRWRIDGTGALVVATAGNDFVTRLVYDPASGTFSGARDPSSRNQDGTRTIMRPLAAQGCPSVAGRRYEWFDNGRRLGVIAFAPDGSAVIDWYPQYRDQRWRVDPSGALIVSTAGNDYVTRLVCQGAAGVFSGERDASSRNRDGVRTEMRPAP